jgi:hypothetical protein
MVLDQYWIDVKRVLLCKIFNYVDKFIQSFNFVWNHELVGPVLFNKLPWFVPQLPENISNVGGPA